jgi:mono/diheme cytochrome c family protein
MWGVNSSNPNQDPTAMKASVSPLLLSSLFLLGIPAAAAADAQANWTQYCKNCHGADGAGHTQAGRMKHVKNLTSAEYQKTFTDEKAASQITGGFKDASGKERMPGFGDRLTKPEIQALVGYVRLLQK